jgi:hypothetical protein
MILLFSGCSDLAVDSPSLGDLDTAPVVGSSREPMVTLLACHPLHMLQNRRRRFFD